MRTRSTLTIAAVAGLLLGTAANGWEVPGMKDLDKTLNGAKSALPTFKPQGFTPEDEYYIGRLVAAKVLAKERGDLVEQMKSPSGVDPVYRDAKANDYVRHVGSLLRLASQRPQLFKGYSFLIVDSKHVNATATPGGHIFVTRGLLQSCDSEDALAAALAHEIAHVGLRHGMESIDRSQKIDLYKQLFMKGVDQIASQNAQEVVGMVNSPVASISETLIQKGYRRNQETAADAEAVRMLREAGYDPRGLLALFDNLESSSLPGKLDFAIVKDHPDVKARREAVEQLVANDPEGRVSTTRQARFEEIRASF